MAYSDRHEWSISSFSDTLYSSDVDESSQPCPLLSSSLTSTLLISNTNNHSLAISTDTISSSAFYSKKEDKATHVLSFSSLDHSHDYYTKKRIEQLHDRMDDIQISSFLKFINYHLSFRTEQKFVQDLSQDLSNGHILIDLIEIFSSKKLKREYGHTRFHSLTNVQYVLDYLKLHMQHINISPHDIVSGNRKQILALLWIIMKIFDFPSFRLTTNKHLFQENTLFSFGQDRSILIKWINNLLNKIFNTNIIYIKDFYLQTWIDCSYLSIIIKYLCPFSLKYDTLQYFDYLKQINEFNYIDQQQERFDLYLNLSNYCFNTISTIDYTDRTEKSLFRFFSELHANILFILKSNHIGKLSKTNLYTKQLLDTVLETTLSEHSPMINEDEDYLICIQDKQYQWNDKENLQSLTDDLCNDEIFKKEIDPISTEKSDQIIFRSKNFEEPIINIQSILSPVDITNLIQEQQLCTQNLSEIFSSINDECQNALRSRKPKKKKSIMSIEKSLSTTNSNSDLFLKLIECLRDSKLITFKYICILACLCFSILIILIHK
ncbi:unnamed protein product [Adineta steineri]|uniref:Calponin-homology (CH) domain-containing protein n=2 Tax=Adineta steineri TaxID=433720 RepID=A0A819EVE9_9BILA|nr:unnamed protein product [Adineta steineri]